MISSLPTINDREDEEEDIENVLFYVDDLSTVDLVLISFLPYLSLGVGSVCLSITSQAA